MAMSSTFLRRRSKPLQNALAQLREKVRRGGVSGVLSDAMIVENCAARPFISTTNNRVKITQRTRALRDDAHRFAPANSKDSHVLDHRHILS